MNVKEKMVVNANAFFVSTLISISVLGLFSSHAWKLIEPHVLPQPLAAEQPKNERVVMSCVAERDVPNESKRARPGG